MSLNIALSGLNAANAELGVASDNIANANTTGFKKSRTEFNDLVNTMSPDRNGLGVRLQQTTQIFAQGSIENTGQTFDMAIVGDGFFQVRSHQQISYTRAGNFSTSPITETVSGQEKTTNYIVDYRGQRLQGFLMQDYPSQSTTEVQMSLILQNVDQYGLANGLENDPADFDAHNPLTYNHMTSIDVVDGLGFVHSLKSYFLHIPPANLLTYDSHSWQVFHQLDDRSVLDGGTVTFDGTPAGTLATNNLVGTLTFSGADLGNNVSEMVINLTNNDNPPLLLNTLPVGSTSLRESSEFNLNTLAANGSLAAQRMSDRVDDLFITSSSLSPKITTQVELGINLSAAEKTPIPTNVIEYAVDLDGSTSVITAAFDPDDATTYNLTNTVEVYDSLGTNHRVQTYFVH